ncbi:MAG: transposase [bacterium]
MTICTIGRQPLFGAIHDGNPQLTAAGQIVAEEWDALANRFRSVSLLGMVVMPNHFHGVLQLCPKEDEEMDCSLDQVVRAFKSITTRRINLADGQEGQTVWQRGYFDRVIRSPEELLRVLDYVEDNPRQWEWDRENPARLERAEPDPWEER